MLQQELEGDQDNMYRSHSVYMTVSKEVKKKCLGEKQIGGQKKGQYSFQSRAANQFIFIRFLKHSNLV